jgi:hypothetical protein
VSKRIAWVVLAVFVVLVGVGIALGNVDDIAFNGRTL